MANKQFPNGLTYRDCYKVIYDWHTKNGNKAVFHFEYPNLIMGQQRIYNGDPNEPYVRAYLDLLKVLPNPKAATPECIGFIFMHAITMLFEWAYQAEDEFGIALGDYAKEGRRLLELDNMGKDKSEGCPLNSNFGYENYKNNYPIPLYKCADCRAEKEVVNIYHKNTLIKEHVCDSCAMFGKKYKRFGSLTFKKVYK